MKEKRMKLIIKKKNYQISFLFIICSTFLEYVIYVKKLVNKCKNKTYINMIL